MQIAFFDARGEDEKRLQEAFPHDVVEVFTTSLTSKLAEESQAEVVSVFVSSQVTREVLDTFPRLKLIAARSAGVDHIDLVACRERGITVVNVPRYGENTVAEHAFALILALSRKIFQSYERTEKMNFDRDGLQGFDLAGKTLGVVGCGNIGRNVVRIGRGFLMNVVVYDVKIDEEIAGQEGVRFVSSLEDLLAVSDVVTLHVPYMKATHHMINKESLAHIKKGAILINTARGGLIETQALLAALEHKALSGVGMDVLEGELDTFDRIAFMSAGSHDVEKLAALVRNHLLVAREDVIITPHNAYNSREAVDKIFRTTTDNINLFVAGNPVHVVGPVIQHS